MCNYGYEVESTVHFLLHFPLFSNERSVLFSALHNLDSKLFENTDSQLTNILLFGKESTQIRIRQFLMQPWNFIN